MFFLFLEAISINLFIRYNNRYGTYYLDASNEVSGTVALGIRRWQNYFKLPAINRALARENTELRKMLGRINRRSTGGKIQDTLHQYYPAEVVNASFRYRKNYLTLRVSQEDSIVSGMGVITSRGVVGRVKSVSSRYATVTSVLHPDLLISGRIKRTGTLCTVQWTGGDPRFASLKFIPRHESLAVGDTIVTSGFNNVFPPEVPVGVVATKAILDEDAFFDASVRLSEDISGLYHVHLVAFGDRTEKDSLESTFRP